MENNLSSVPKSEQRFTGKKIVRIVGFTIMGVLFAALFALVFGFLVKILWNWLMPAIFGIVKISYWQAFGLVILAKLLFGGFGSHHGYDRKDHFHSKVDSRWHRLIGVEDRSHWGPADSPTKWKYYEQFWHEEGKAAFESYIDKIKSEKTEKEND